MTQAEDKKVPPLLLTDRFTEAVSMAHRYHRHDARKGTSIPYLAHLLSVSALVLEHGGTEDQAIAALLHDAAEDQGGQRTVDSIRAAFGDDVAGIVAGCSDSFAVDSANKEAWWPRKVRYLDHLNGVSAEALLVSAADKLHNARSTLDDYRADGEGVWRKFKPEAGRGGSLWYYRRLLEMYRSRLDGGPMFVRLVDELGRTVDALCDLAQFSADDLEAARRKEEETRANAELG